MKLTKLLNEIYLPTEKYYHGSGHYFRYFRHSGIGGGSGAQIYGWGFYFGKDKGIALGFIGLGANKKSKVFMDGFTLEELGFKYDCGAFDKLPEYKTKEEYEEYIIDMIDLLEGDDDYIETIEDYKRALNIIQNEITQIEDHPTKYLYEVELNEGIYLDWDKKILEDKEIQMILDQANKENIDINPNDIKNINFVTDNLTNVGGPKEISLFLNRAGIKGYTHSNSGVRIVINPNDIKILKINKEK